MSLTELKHNYKKINKQYKTTMINHKEICSKMWNNISPKGYYHFKVLQNTEQVRIEHHQLKNAKEIYIKAGGLIKNGLTKQQLVNKYNYEHKMKQHILFLKNIDKTNDTTQLDYLYKSMNYTIIYTIIENNLLNIFKYIIINKPNNIYILNLYCLITRSYRSNNIEMAEWLCDYHKDEINKSNIERIKWYLYYKYTIDSPITQYFFETFNCNITSEDLHKKLIFNLHSTSNYYEFGLLYNELSLFTDDELNKLKNKYDNIINLTDEEFYNLQQSHY
jgi:hypothetical protein